MTQKQKLSLTHTHSKVDKVIQDFDKNLHILSQEQLNMEKSASLIQLYADQVEKVGLYLFIFRLY